MISIQDVVHVKVRRTDKENLLNIVCCTDDLWGLLVNNDQDLTIKLVVSKELDDF